MLRRALALKLFEAFSMQRWNDMIRPVELTEMDKHAHKMIIAYCLGKYEEEKGRQVNWEILIKGGVFELLRRIVISDIKSPIYRKIKILHPDVFLQLNKWVYEQLKPALDGLPKEIKTELKNYLFGTNKEDDLTKKILEASHIYSSFWEFQIIQKSHPTGYKIEEIERVLKNDLEPYLDLAGMRKIVCKGNISNFLDLCGHLRFQIRWSQTPRLPKTSVLGHMLLVAIFCYLFAREVNACSKRVYNNFFSALFHDLPEAVTRDILSPIKRSVEGMPETISKIEEELAEKEISPLLEEGWFDEIKYFTRNEYESKIKIKGRVKHVTTEMINEKYNHDNYDPIDGEFIKIADDLAAYLEAYSTNSLGLYPKHLKDGRDTIEKKYKGRSIAGMSIEALFADYAT
ncbi:MAG: HD domain-containing protein [Candidatus Kuenenia sp.]|nr:HD domain-containing protein [Candidatus Kuenenia hertensis]